MSSIDRNYDWNRYTLTSSSTTTPPIIIGGKAFGRVYIPPSSSITSLTYWDCPNVNGRQPPFNGYTDTYVAAYDAAGAAVTQTVAAGRSYPIPTAVAGSGTIKLVADAPGVVDVGLKG